MKPTTMPNEVMTALVSRFLCWKLPKDFCPDAGITFERKVNGKDREDAWGPVGTNLFTAEQAKEMFNACFSGLLFQELPLIDENEITQLRAEVDNLNAKLVARHYFNGNRGFADLRKIEKLRAERDALAAQNEQLRDALELTYNLDMQGAAYYDFEEARHKALSLPNLSAVPLARVKAEAFREAAEICEDTYWGEHKIFSDALRAKADDILKEVGL